MKFLVSKTSVWSDVKPCESASRDKYIRIDVRGCDCPSKIPLFNGNFELANKDWLSEGKNHRVERGCIMRDFDEEGWFIEINNLEELIDFKNDSGSEIIVKNSYFNDKIYEIEIYDDYRE